MKITSVIYLRIKLYILLIGANQCAIPEIKPLIRIDRLCYVIMLL